MKKNNRISRNQSSSKLYSKMAKLIGLCMDCIAYWIVLDYVYYNFHGICPIGCIALFRYNGFGVFAQTRFRIFIFIFCTP